MNETVRVGIVGLGTVGTGVVRLLADSTDHISRHAGRQIRVAQAVCRDIHKNRNLPLSADQVSSDIQSISLDPSISVAVLLVGGLEPARSMTIELLEHGKDIVTANKALLAEHGPELFDLARRKGRSIAFEASIAGGIPIVAAISECLAANRIQSIRGILNGTSNFILSTMEEDAADYSETLTRAQAEGYAEADPSMDVDGTDATQKLAILAHLAFGQWVPWHDIQRTGIENVDLDLIRFAHELGYRIRLIAVAQKGVDGLAMRVAPTLVRLGTPLAETHGAFNAVSVLGDAVGPMFFHGLGAGQMPTASAVVADIIDTVVGRTAITFQTTGLLDASRSTHSLNKTDLQGRFFLRFHVTDKPGILAHITGILGEYGISIASVIQHEAPNADTTGVPLVIMTHICSTQSIQNAMAAIDVAGVTQGMNTCLSVLDE
ncbi:MAG: homoserine dehydrogenase [Pirellulales bacterium]